MKISRLISVSFLIAVMSACTTTKEVMYFQDIKDRQLNKVDNEYEAIIKKDDRLVIVVTGPDKAVTSPYNLTLTEISGMGSASDPERATLSYLVDAQGNIDFPILGAIHVEGMTRNQLVRYLTKEIGKDVKDPIVYVSFKNYKITVLGEVRNPGTYFIDSEKVNILQAIGKAGDLLITARRDGIILLREVDGVQTSYEIDLRNSDILESPYFYLQQNDVLYIPPSPTRVTSGTAATNIWSAVLSSVTTAISVISLVIALSK